MTALIRLGDILQSAVSKGDLHRVRELLEKGAPVNERQEHGTTVLHWAASNDEAEIVRSLLQAGANPNARAADGCTPLHYAAREDAAKATALLLQYGADCGVTNNAGRVAVEEIYDDQDDGEGAEIARLLTAAAGVGVRVDGGGIMQQQQQQHQSSDERNGEINTGGAAQLASIGASTGATFSSLEFAMADMAALLRREKKAAAAKTGGSTQTEETTPVAADIAVEGGGGLGEHGDTAAAAASTTTMTGAVRSGGSGVGSSGVTTGVSSSTTNTATSSTFSGGEGGEGGGRVIVPRAYVPAADHDDVPQKRPEARTVVVRLRSDGTMSDEDYANVRQSYMETGLPRTDPQARGGGGGGVGGGGGGAAGEGSGSGGSYYQRIPEVAQTKLEARRRDGANKVPVMVSSGCGEGGGE